MEENHGNLLWCMVLIQGNVKIFNCPDFGSANHMPVSGTIHISVL